MKESCSYCRKPLGDSYTFSYGVPGIPRTYGCKRRICLAKRGINRKLDKYYIVNFKCPKCDTFLWFRPHRRKIFWWMVWLFPWIMIGVLFYVGVLELKPWVKEIANERN